MVGKMPEGTFSTTLDATDMAALERMTREPEPVDIVLYGPARMPRWKRLIYRIAGHFGVEWPTEIIARGQAWVDWSAMSTPGEDVRVTGDFRASGEWEIRP